MTMTAVAAVSALCYTTHCSGRRVGIAEVRCRDKVTIFGRSNGDCVNNAHLTPVGAFDYSGRTTMSCQFSIVYCPLHKGGLVPCEFKGREDECPLAKAGGCRRIPSVEECIKLYEANAACSAVRKRNVRNLIENAVARCGRRMDESASVFSASVFDGLKAKMLEGGYEPSSVAAVFSAFQAVTSRKLRKAYETAAVERPSFDVPEVEVKRGDVKVLTDKQKLAITEWMTDLRRSRKSADRSKYLALFFMRYFAMRPDDVNRLTMDNIVRVPEGLALQYVPHKTSRSSSRKVDYWIDPKVWILVEELLKDMKPGDFIITRNAKCFAGKAAHGELVGAHSRMWADINRKFRSFGIASYNCVYKCRGWRLNEAYVHGGIQEEFALSQHSGRIAMRHYIKAAYRPGA